MFLSCQSGDAFCVSKHGGPQFLDEKYPLAIVHRIHRCLGSYCSYGGYDPLDEDPIPSIHPAMYALEMTQGWFHAHGVMVGQTVAGLPEPSVR